jgi:ankyrin repeat protein
MALPDMYNADQQWRNTSLVQRFTRIFEACATGNEALLRKELQHKSSRVNFQMKSTGGLETIPPIMGAATGGHISCIACLLEHNADINLQASTGATALTLACQNGQVKALHFLVEKGATVDIRKKNGCTPLYMASLRGHLACAKAMLSYGAGVHIAATDEIAGGIKGATPLFVAASQGLTPICDLLVRCSANIDQPCENGATPLIAASNAGYEEVVSLLLSAGADAAATDAGGLTALQHAEENEHDACVKVLLEPPKSRADGGASNLADAEDVALNLKAKKRSKARKKRSKRGGGHAGDGSAGGADDGDAPEPTPRVALTLRVNASRCVVATLSLVPLEPTGDAEPDSDDELPSIPMPTPKGALLNSFRNTGKGNKPPWLAPEKTYQGLVQKMYGGLDGADVQ